MFNYADIQNAVVVGLQSSGVAITSPNLIVLTVGQVVNIGDLYDSVAGTFTAPTIVTPTVLPLTNILITNAVLHNSIYWIAENTMMTITGNVAMPDGQYMLMAERFVDSVSVIDDARFIATLSAGVMTVNVTFSSTGNYKFSADRINRGLDRIAAGFHLSFADIEFDVYV